jgi:hypothetical protein
MRVIGGYTNYGQSIGILMLDTVFPRIPGDIGNALTYGFPVRYKIVKGAQPERIMGHAPEKHLLDPFIQAAKELEAEGVKAITTSCGFLSRFQAEIAGAVKVPVFTSALMLVPLVHAMLGRTQPIGIFTERAQYMNEEHFRSVGWSSRDIPVVVKGMKEDAVFPTIFIGNKSSLDTAVLQAEMQEMAEEFIAENPQAGAIVLECTNMGPFSKVIAELTGVPVFGVNALANFVHQAISPPQYGQGKLRRKTEMQ